jgi:hypothetical protein
MHQWESGWESMDRCGYYFNPKNKLNSNGEPGKFSLVLLREIRLKNRSASQISLFNDYLSNNLIPVQYSPFKSVSVLRHDNIIDYWK